MQTMAQITTTNAHNTKHISDKHILERDLRHPVDRSEKAKQTAKGPEILVRCV